MIGKVVKNYRILSVIYLNLILELTNSYFGSFNLNISYTCLKWWLILTSSLNKLQISRRLVSMESDLTLSGSLFKG